MTTASWPCGPEAVWLAASSRRVNSTWSGSGSSPRGRASLGLDYEQLHDLRGSAPRPPAPRMGADRSDDLPARSRRGSSAEIPSCRAVACCRGRVVRNLQTSAISCNTLRRAQAATVVAKWVGALGLAGLQLEVEAAWARAGTSARWSSLTCCSAGSVKLPPEIAKPLRYVRKIYCTGSLPGGVNGLLRTLAKSSNPFTR